MRAWVAGALREERQSVGVAGIARRLHCLAQRLERAVRLEHRREAAVRRRRTHAAVAAARGDERPVAGEVERLLEAGIGEQALQLDRSAVAGEIAITVAVVQPGQAALVLAAGLPVAGATLAGVDRGRAREEVVDAVAPIAARPRSATDCWSEAAVKPQLRAASSGALRADDQAL